VQRASVRRLSGPTSNSRLPLHRRVLPVGRGRVGVRVHQHADTLLDFSFADRRLRSHTAKVICSVFLASFFSRQILRYVLPNILEKLPWLESKDLLRLPRHRTRSIHILLMGITDGLGWNPSGVVVQSSILLYIWQSMPPRNFSYEYKRSDVQKKSVGALPPHIPV